nr:methionyl-tRNA formyltransferase [uncultured Porphyromonas sp.]
MNKEQLRILYLATADFALPSLRALVEQGYNVVAVVTMPDKPAGRGHKLRESSIKTYAREVGLEVLQPERLRDEAFIQRLRELAPDLGVVVAFRMLPEIVWSLPRFGTINLHGSLLPRYRGAAPIHWAIINGDQETGVTTFRLRHELDTGDLLLQARLPIAPEDNVGKVHDSLMHVGAETLVKTVDLFLQGKEPEGIPQSSVDEAPTPAPKLTKENTELHWDRPTMALHNQVRGLSPYPAAWATLTFEGHPPTVFKILESAPLPSPEGTPAPPAGTLVLLPKGRLAVATLDGLLEIKTLQPPGKKAMPAAAYLNGLR